MRTDPVRLDAIRRARAAGLSYARIGAQLGISRQRVQQIHARAERREAAQTACKEPRP